MHAYGLVEYVNSNVMRHVLVPAIEVLKKADIGTFNASVVLDVKL